MHLQQTPTPLSATTMQQSKDFPLSFTELVLFYQTQSLSVSLYKNPYKFLLLTYKSLKARVPQYLCDLLHPYTKSQMLRSPAMGQSLQCGSSHPLELSPKRALQCPVNGVLQETHQKSSLQLSLQPLAFCFLYIYIFV